MKVIVDGLDLSDGVLKVSKALNAKKLNSVLEGIKLSAKGDTLTLTATDTELTIERVIKAEVLMEGDTVVTGKYFGDFIKKLDQEQVELSDITGQLKIKYSDSESEMQIYNAEEFPKINKDIKGNTFSLSQKEFKDVVTKTVFACAQDESRPILKGCLFEVLNDTLTAVALDGYRMTVCNKKLNSASGNFKAVIPSRTLLEITRLLEKDEDIVDITIQKNSLMLEVGNTTLISRLLEGEFINYKQILPTSFVTEVRINKNMLLNSVERASILSRLDRMSMVKFDVKENYLNVISKSEIGNVNESIPISLEGKDVLIAFNSKYISEYLRISEDEFVRIYMNSPIAPCVFRPMEGNDYIYLVLPVRINN